jgi:signal recognition particle GTPase
MNDLFIRIHAILNSILINKVYYGKNQVDNAQMLQAPFIVYNERSNRGIVYSDNHARVRESIIQVTLVTKNKDTVLEDKLENTLIENDIEFQMVTEFINDDNSISRVYEVRMEVIK